MDDEATGQGGVHRRSCGGRGGGGRQQRDDTVRVQGFKMPWRLWSDGERVDRLQAAAKARGDGGADGELEGGSGGCGTDLPEMSFNVSFAERTADGDDAMEIDG